MNTETISKRLQKTCEKCVKHIKEKVEANGGKYSGLCNYASFYLSQKLKEHKGVEATPVMFWEKHVACLVGNLVIDLTSKQFNHSNPDILILSKDDYVYWLSGDLYNKNFFVLCTEWDLLEKNGSIVRLDIDSQKVLPPEQQYVEQA
jgi:hypothetical protein